MDDLGGGPEHDLAPSRAHGRAEIDVLGVHEEALVHQADGFRVRAAYQHARAADPVHVPLVPRDRLDIGRDWAAVAASADEQLLPELGERRDHAAERELGAAIRVDET